MGLVVETILAAKQNITGGAFEALNPGTDDTFVIRDYVQGSRAFLEEVWGLDDANKCQFSIASPRMNDGQFGLRLTVPSGAAVGPAEEPQILFPGPGRLPVYRADTLKVQVDGTANDDVLLAMTIRYEDLQGSDANLKTWGEVENLIVKTFGILVQPTAAAANYGAPVAINSVDDRLEADCRYALLGAITDSPVGLISISGPDTGRYRIGLPGKVDPTVGADWFVQESAKYGAASIPIIKSNNAGSTLVSVATSNSTPTPNISLIMAQLAN